MSDCSHERCMHIHAGACAPVDARRCPACCLHKCDRLSAPRATSLSQVSSCRFVATPPPSCPLSPPCQSTRRTDGTGPPAELGGNASDPSGAGMMQGQRCASVSARLWLGSGSGAGRGGGISHRAWACKAPPCRRARSARRLTVTALDV